MARFIAALLFASSLLAIAQLSHAAAAPSTAEEFWHTVLPQYELPDAILWHLHTDDTSTESTEKSLGTGHDTGNAVVDDSAERLSRQWPYYYWKDSALRRSSGGHPHTPSEPAVADDDAERLSRQWPYYYWKDSALLHKSSTGHSHMPAAGHNNRAKTNNMHSAVFFHEASVQIGRSLPFFFPPARRPALGMLQCDAADSIPFSTSALPGLLALLAVAKSSPQAADMEETVSMCEAPPVAGEPKFCATSLEALVQGAMAALGSHDIRPVTSMLPRSGAPWQPYTIRAVRPVVVGVGSRFVGCHQVVYPYTMYRCHDTGMARLFMVDMEGARGSAVTAAVICHIDTSLWDPDHPSFKLLGTKPGGPPVCHTMPYGHIIWVKNEGDHASA